MMRERLPNRRASISFEFNVGGLRYTASVSRFGDGRIAEVFIQNSKPGSTSDSYARDSGIAASLAMQHGCSLDALRRAVLRDPQGLASTPLGVALDLIASMEATP
jgi:ribonucleoside-diphosphate reductase alpha chain